MKKSYKIVIAIAVVLVLIGVFASVMYVLSNKGTTNSDEQPVIKETEIQDKDDADETESHFTDETESSGIDSVTSADVDSSDVSLSDFNTSTNG